MHSKIIIAKPCHENWNKMTPEEQGRHCGACNKVVQDFTKMKTEEIIHTLKNSQGEVCGRIGANKLTPTNQKQKIWFWMNRILFRKAIYPVMALLGITLVAKKAHAQVGDYPVKGKMDVRDYHTSNKKVNVVVKSTDDTPIKDASIRIISGVVNEQKPLITDANGRAVFNIDPANLSSNTIEIEIMAYDYEVKVSKIQLTKDIQTVEIRMDYEIIIMGEMMFVPDEKTEDSPIIQPDALPVVKVDVCKCDFKELVKLPVIAVNKEFLSLIETEKTDTHVVDEKIEGHIVQETGFTLFPNPSTDFVTIQSTGKEKFNVDIFDGNGKKIHAITNANERYLLDLTKYAAGTYYALITVNGIAIETKKIIVSR